MLKLKTPALVEPVSYEEAKAYLKLEEDYEEALINRLILAARSAIEAHIGQSLSLQVYTLSVDSWETIEGELTAFRQGSYAQIIRHPAYPLTGLKLKKPPVISIEELRVDNIVIEPVVYKLVNNCLVAAPGQRLPEGELIAVDYKVGYEIVPADLAHAILLLVTEWYADRTPEGVLPIVVQQLCERYKVVKL